MNPAAFPHRQPILEEGHALLNSQKNGSSEFSGEKSHVKVSQEHHSSDKL